MPDNPNKPYDIKELILKVVDEGDFFESSIVYECMQVVWNVTVRISERREIDPEGRIAGPRTRIGPINRRVS